MKYSKNFCDYIYNEVLDNINEGLIITDDEIKIIKVNKICEEITGYKYLELKGKNPNILSSDRLNSEQSFRKIWKQIHNNNYWIGEISNRHKDGHVYPVIMKIKKVIEEKTNKVLYFAIFSDISLEQNSTEELLHLAYHDSLTNLPNRLKLKAQLEYVIKNSQRNNLKFAVLFLDLDNFKTINDDLGHYYGDEVLISFANKFKHIIRSNDMIARVGGDEFIVVLSDIHDYIFIERIANKILSLVNKPLYIKEKEFHIGVSIGIAVYPENGQDVHELISNADIAMYHAKENGKNTFEFYSEGINKKLLTFSKREKQLYNALKNDEFFINVQPEIDLLNNKVFSLEVLSRWYNPNEGIVQPCDFIKDLETTQLIFDFEKVVLLKACHILKELQIKDSYDGTICVNISGKHLEYGNLFECVRDALNSSNLQAKYLELEFHESDIMKISEKNLLILDKLSKLGVGLSIDNFGKGFLSFNYLKDCFITKLKIDKSYIDSLMKENSDEDIIKSIVGLGVNMGISVIAEGIELPKQDEIIKKSCQKVQGYFYAKPMSIEDFETWYNEYKLINTTS